MNINTICRQKPKGHIKQIRFTDFSGAILFIIMLFESVIGSYAEDIGENNYASRNRKSELNFESRNLTAIPPSELLCPEDEARTKITTISVINVVSFERNKIRQIGPNSFVCISAFLRILKLSFNEIEHIRPGAFNQLESVQVLLLENNLLTSVPSIETLSPLKSIRHLNLAYNRIEFVESKTFNSNSTANLISLNLKGNPLREVTGDAFIQLVRLKTLDLSSNMIESEMNDLQGLSELEFYYLERNAHLETISENLCKTSSKLSSLILKSNQFKKIPNMKSQCQNLLILDLSHNSISGSLTGNFSQFPQLLDLYLGSNQINSIEEKAFDGLAELQVLDLSNNQLTYFHPFAFSFNQKLSNSLYDLNIANNKLLSSFKLKQGSLDKLASFKSYGNSQLRELPKFKSVILVALTYAYHCCDYSTTTTTQSQTSNEDSLQHYNHNHYHHNAEPIIYKIINSISLKLSQFFFSTSTQESSAIETNNSSNPHVDLKYLRPATSQTNELSEVIVWPGSPLADMLTNNTNHAHKLNGELDITSLPLANSNNRSLRFRRDYGSPNERLLIELFRLRREYGVGVYSLLQMSRFRRGSDWTTSGNSRAPPVRGTTTCLPAPNALSPCSDLFDSWWLRMGIWFVFLSSFGGNLVVIIVHCTAKQSSSSSNQSHVMWLPGHSKRHIDVPRFLVINLAIADLLMSLYLAILAVVDISSLGEFKKIALRWQYSSACKLAAFFGVLSSELSVFILAVITLERSYAITNAVHLNRRLSLQKAMVVMLIGYAFALVMAILPLRGIGDYRKYSICLPIEAESSFANQLYVMSLLIINTTSFLLLLTCYLRMYCAIRGSQAWNTNDLRIAKRMSILVMTDFLCWSPIIISAFASLFGHQIIGNQGLKVMTIFVLPLNSIANPFLYAITTKKFKRDLSLLSIRLRLLCLPSCLLGYCSNGCCSSCKESEANRKQKEFEKYINFNKNAIANKSRFQNNNFDQKQLPPGQATTKRHQQQLQLAQIELGNKQLRRQAQQRVKSKLIDLTDDDQDDNREKGNNLVTKTNSKKRIRATSGGGRKRADCLTAATGNQVTVNKTTCCSCQHHRIVLATDIEISGGNLADSSSSSSGHKQQARPRIVLQRALEPVVSLALATSCGLTRKSVSNQDVLIRNSISSGDLKKKSELHQLAVSQQLPSSNFLLKPYHPEAAKIGVERTTKVSPNSSSQEPVRRNRPVSRVYLSVTPNCTSFNRLPAGSNIIPDRSASACGYQQDRHLPIAGSCCDSMGATFYEPTNQEKAAICRECAQSKQISTRKLVRSISRLLFEPFARAWSSSHMSAGSNLTQEPSQRQQQCLISPELVIQHGDHLDDSLYNQEAPDATVTLEDLIMNSPNIAIYRANGRRMSRSCEIITNSQHQPLVSPCLSSGADNSYLISGPAGQATNTTTTTSSSHIEDDDRRILLATINRIAAKRTISTATTDRRHQDSVGNWAQRSGYPRATCTRCRSWSPALLGKLEDCFNQIKGKIPGLAKVKNQMAGGRNGTLNEATTSVTGNTHISSDENDNRSSDGEEFNLDELVYDDDDDEIGGRLFEGEHIRRRDELDPHNSDDGNSKLEEQVDQFDCTRVRRSNMKRLQQSRRKQLSKLHQYSSANSDTLSTKTERTLLMNTSLSVDSTTNLTAAMIPTQTLDRNASTTSAQLIPSSNQLTDDNQTDDDERQ